MPYKDPEKQRQYQREYKRLRRVGSCRTPVKLFNPGDPVRIQTARDVLNLLEVVIQEVRVADVDILTRARCLGYLAAIILKAIEVGDFEERLSRLEEIVEQRGG